MAFATTEPRTATVGDVAGSVADTGASYGQGDAAATRLAGASADHLLRRPVIGERCAIVDRYEAEIDAMSEPTSDPARAIRRQT